jgi:phenylpropionate dioxygenase-like ring-hydroxylating dioxygenase large terminal subunit
LIEELDDPNNVDATAFFFRDMPYSWEMLVENLCDPSHIPFAHHDMMRTADRYNVEMIDMEVFDECKTGFKARKTPYPTGKGQYDVRFEAPCLLYYQIVDSGGKSFLGLGEFLFGIATVHMSSILTL